jgi:hypothetical protein
MLLCAQEALNRKAREAVPRRSQRTSGPGFLGDLCGFSVRPLRFNAFVCAAFLALFALNAFGLYELDTPGISLCPKSEYPEEADLTWV